MVLAWENIRSFLFIFVHFVVVVVLHLSSFVDVFHFVGVVSLFDFQATLPCHQHSNLASQTREGLDQLWALLWLLSIAFSFSSTARATVLSGHFLPTSVFYLTLLPNIFGTFPIFLAHSRHFGTTCFYQGFAGSRQLLSWKLQGFILILKTQTRPICLFDSL